MTQDTTTQSNEHTVVAALLQQILDELQKQNTILQQQTIALNALVAGLTST